MDELPTWMQVVKRITSAVVFLFSLSALGGLMVGAPLEGALIGGGVGAGTGALTNQNQINLGRPIWR
jgi:hypothetical protein